MSDVTHTRLPCRTRRAHALCASVQPARLHPPSPPSATLTRP